MSKCTKKTISWLLTLVMMFTMVMPVGAMPVYAEDVTPQDDDGGTSLIAAPVWPEDCYTVTTDSITITKEPTLPDGYSEDDGYCVVYKFVEDEDNINGTGWLNLSSFAGNAKNLTAGTKYKIAMAYGSFKLESLAFVNISEWSIKEITTEADTTLLAAPVWPEDLNLQTTYYSISFNQPAACSDTSYTLVYRKAKSAEELESNTSWLSYAQVGFGDTFADYNNRSGQDMLDADTTYYVQAAYRTGSWGSYVFSGYSEVKQMKTAAAPEKAKINFSIVAATKPSETPVISATSADYKGAEYFTWYNKKDMEITPGTTMQAIAQTGFDALGFEDFTVPTGTMRLSVTMPEMLGSYTLGNRSYGSMSAWYITVKHNGQLQKENTSFTNIKPHEGDEVILHYTFNYGCELLSYKNDGVSGNFVNAPALDTSALDAANEVITKIKAIGALAEVTAESKTTITAARTAYNALSTKAQALVTNLADLTAAEARIAKIEAGTITALATPTATAKEGAATAKAVTITVPANTVDTAASVQTRYSTDGATWSDWATATAGDITISGLQASTSYQIQVRYKTSDSDKYANSAVASVNVSTTAFETVTVEVSKYSELKAAISGADATKQTTIKLTADIEMVKDGGPYNGCVTPEGANVILDGDGHKIYMYTGNQNSTIVGIGKDSTVTLRNITLGSLRPNNETLAPGNYWSTVARFTGDNGVLNIEKDAVLLGVGNGYGLVYNGAFGWMGAAGQNVTVNIYGGVLHNLGDKAYSKLFCLKSNGTVNIVPADNLMMEGTIEDATVNIKPGAAIKSGVALDGEMTTYTKLTAEQLGGTGLTYAGGLRCYTTADTEPVAVKAPVVVAADDANAATADITYVIADDKITFTVKKRDTQGVLMFKMPGAAWWRYTADTTGTNFSWGDTFTSSSLTKDTEYTYLVQTASLNPLYKDATNTLTLRTTYTAQKLDAPASLTLDEKTTNSLKFSAPASTQDTTATVQYRISTDGETWGDWQDSNEFTGLTAFTEYHCQARYKAVSKYWSDSDAGEATKNSTKAAELTAPVLGAAANVAVKTVTLAAPAVSAQDSTASVMYRMSTDGETWGDWQVNAVFTGLKANTKYYFQAKYVAGAAAWVDSPASNTITAQTTVDANAPAFVIGQVSGRAGSEVQVPVEIKNNPGIVSVRLFVGWDATKLELVKVDDTELLPNFVGTDSLATNPYVLYWEDGSAKQNITANGKLATLTFKIKNDCTLNDVTAITLTYDANDVFDKDLNNVTFDKTNGSVTVVAHQWNAPTYTWSSDHTTCTATRTCADSGCTDVKETETVTATVKRTEPSESSNGSVVYTATFTNTAFTTQTYTETLYATGASFTVSQVTAAHGGNVDVDIKIASNPGIINARVDVAYDDTKLELVGVKDANLLNGFVSSKTFTANPYRLTWEDGENKQNITANGTVATLTFKVKATCKVGDVAPISITLSSIYNTDKQAVSFRAVGGSVTVAEHAYGDATYKWSADHSTCTATSECSCGDKLIETVNAQVSTTPSTCSKAGQATYTATFTNTAFTKQTYDEPLALAAHDYVVSGGLDSAALVYTCTVCQGKKMETVGGDTPVLVVANACGNVNDEVVVTISAKNNPGIIAATLQLAYNTEELQLVKSENACGLKTFSVSGNTIKLGGLNETANLATDGALVNLTFKVLADTKSGSSVSITYKPADVYNFDMQAVAFAIDNGQVTVGSYLLGDVNDDSVVDLLDVTILRRYLAGWEGYDDIVKLAADVNVDGDITLQDATILRRYLAGWEDVQLGQAS